MHSSQPAVFHQLAAIEREAGTALFRREPRGVALTPASRHRRRATRSVGEATGGSLRLACTQSLTVATLAPIIRRWHRVHPDVTISLREAAVLETFLGYLDSREVGMTLLPMPVPGRFTATVVAEEEIVLATPSGHPLARRATVRLKDLEGARLVHYAPENGPRRTRTWSCTGEPNPMTALGLWPP
ncbi:MAG: LysR family transcriptional regulator [Mycobacterium sp.]